MNNIELNTLRYTKEVLECIEYASKLRSKENVIAPIHLALSLLFYSKFISYFFNPNILKQRKFILKSFECTRKEDGRSYHFSKELLNILIAFNKSKYVCNTITLLYIILKNDRHSFKTISSLLGLDPLNVLMVYMKKVDTTTIPENIKNFVYLSSENISNDIIGRNEEIEQIKYILSNSTNNSLVLLGKEGVGKKSLIRKLICIINKNKTCLTLDLFNLLSIQDTDIINSVFKYLRSIQNLVLYLKDFELLFTDFSSNEQSIYCKKIIFYLIETGSLTILGVLTKDENITLPKEINKVYINEPITSLLRFILYKYYKYNQFIYNKTTNISSSLINYLISLGNIYMKSYAFPKKGFMILDVLCNNKNININEDDIIQAIAYYDSNAVKSKIKNITREDLQRIESKLKNRVYGQEGILNKIFSILKHSLIGIKDNTKPLGSFLFCGPSGTGKTELVKSLSDFLMNSSLIRFDMSEYMEKHSISKLIGCPPGYVGHEEGGLLTEAIKNKPRSVILFDEIEKAHPDINNIMLQILDEGRITDSRGNTIDCTQTIVIYTSNLGCPISPESFVSFVKGTNFSDQEYKELSNNVNNAIKKFFKPEFLNRLDFVAVFKPLDITYLVSIVDKFILDIRKRLEINRIPLILILDNDVKQLIAKIAYHPLYGARPLKRIINQVIEKPISDLVLNYKFDSPHVFSMFSIKDEIFYLIKKA